MRVFSVIAVILLSSTSFSQTAVIFSKSHSGDLQFLLDEPDNFGEPPPSQYDTIVLLENNCIVEIGEHWRGNRFNDTICNHWYFNDGKYTIKKAAQHYGAAKYMGFEGLTEKDVDGNIFWTDGSPIQNKTPWVFSFIILSFLSYLFIPLLKKKHQ